MSEESKDDIGHMFTTLFEYKQKYDNVMFEITDSIPRSSVKEILGIVKLSDFGDLVKKGDRYIVDEIFLVYEDKQKRVHITIPTLLANTNVAIILKNLEKIVITNKIEMLKKIIQEAVMKKEKDSYITRSPDENLYYNRYSKIIYYTDEVKIKGNLLPEKGFYYVYCSVYNVNTNGSIYTNDKDILKFAAKYIIELNGIKVNNLKELIQMFMKFKDKFYITEDTLANFKGNEVISFANTCAVPLYLDYLVIYTNDFKAEIGCGLILKKGVIAFGYEWVAASPDVWSALSTPL
jgi:hypothetical protein